MLIVHFLSADTSDDWRVTLLRSMQSNYIYIIIYFVNLVVVF